MLSLFDCICIIVGTIIGAGIFKMPSIIAAQVPNVYWMAAVWIFGGIIALIGALCFAELTTTYPDRGGDYGYLKRGFHRHLGFAFSWTAFWVIRPTSIGLMALIFGEFAQTLFPDTLPIAGFAILSVVALSLTNLLGIKFGTIAQNILTVAKVIGILMVVIAAFVLWPSSKADSNSLSDNAGVVAAESGLESDLEPGLSEGGAAEANGDPGEGIEAKEETEAASTWEWFWLSMVFVMFTFGGWNDIAFVATETRDHKKNLFWALVLGTVVVLAVYLLFNFSLVYGLGFDRLKALGIEWENGTKVLVEQNMGATGSWLLSILVCVSCLGAVNAMILTSPRIYWATACDYPGLSWMTGTTRRGWWPSMLLQALVTVAYILAFGTEAKGGVEKLTNANAPFFWFFLALTVTSLVVSRFRFSGQKFEGYRVPLFPILPAIFVCACLFMVYRSSVYMMGQNLHVHFMVIAGWVAVGLVLSFFMRSSDSEASVLSE